jgi:CheY-like chemotaxis protein/anti-sigma regulatory factor (Ser/Thr protein kinase)
MVRSLLSFARQGRAEDRELDLNAILREDAGLLGSTLLSKVRLELDLEGALRPIRGDASSLTHAIMNLCVNAVDAMPEQGTLTLRTRNVDSDWIEVVVEDTGTGMSKEVLERALDPFFTTKAVGKGTGLGLSMVYNTVKAHQGQLELHSEPGRGTRVRLRFPACEPATKSGGEDEETRSSTLPSSLTVLLVDDDDLIQSSVQTLLQALGHAAFTASSGEEALLAVEEGLEPDAVILDMNMPGLGGSGTLSRLRALRPEVPVLLSTGRTDQTALELAAAHAYVTLLPKPFTLKELQRRLEGFGRKA